MKLGPASIPPVHRLHGSSDPFGPAIRACSRAVLLALGMAVTAGPTAAQQAATIAGTIDFDMGSGRLTGAVCVRDGHGPADPVRIELNAVLQLVRVDGEAPVVGERREVPGGDAVRYELRRPTGAEVGSPVCFDYAGVIPRYPDTNQRLRDVDHAGVLAFDGRTLRARGAARWLPFPIDSANDMPAEIVHPDLVVRCVGCATIYLNGHRPMRGERATFRGDRAAEPFLLLGDDPVRPAAGGWIIAPDSLWDRADSILSIARRIDRIYQDYLGIAERPVIDLVAFPEVREPVRGRAWAFFADPALALESSSIATVARALESDRREPRENAFALLAHEAAHRYFGWRLGRRSPQRDLFGEPLATLLELHAVHEVLGADALKRRLEDVSRRAARLTNPTPLASATQRDFADADYRYGFAPLRLLELAERFGEDGTPRLLRRLLNLDPATADHATWSTLEALAAELRVLDQ